MILEHANTSLLKAIDLAGNQLELAKILEVHPSQISAWLHNSNVNMPYKYGKIIETWSNGYITESNLFPNIRNTEVISQGKITALSLEMLVKRAEEAGVALIISVSLDTNNQAKSPANTH